MATTEAGTGIFKRLDQLNEFERQPVTNEKLHGGMYFAGSFAGEHVAATEFVIGALFVAGGAHVHDVVVGLLLGNLLAVLSWTLICTPIAVKTRLTLYWYLRKIAGPAVMVIYNVLNAALYCVLAGCMITVAASAVRIPFGIEPQTGWLPTDPWFVVVTVVVGAVVVLLAILGFKRLAQFAAVCSPWMFIMFVAGALVLLPMLGHFGSLTGLWELGEARVWTGAPPYQSVITPQGGAAPGEIILQFADDEELLIAKGLPRPADEGEDEEEDDEGNGGEATPEAEQPPATEAEAASPNEPETTAPEAETEPGPPEGGPSESPSDGEIRLTGFAIAGTGPGERGFVPADARIDGNRVIVSSPAVQQPAVVSYDETLARGNLRVKRNAQDGEGQPVPRFRSYVASAAGVLTFWHIVAFAWICNLAMHLGLSDMALFRYARRSWYGLYSAFGMYLGHYVAWICAGIMGAAVASTLMMNTPLTLLDSGEVAFRALGVMGALAVVIAGWTTSNPTLYRAGLALQVVTPGWPRWLVTLVAGAITTVIACFPFVFRQLLNFVGIYGLLLMPVGAIVVVEHWIFPWIGFKRFWAARKGLMMNWPALLAWVIALVAALVCWQGNLIHLFFLAGPVWILTAVLYVAFAAMAGAAGEVPDLPEEEPAPAPPPEKAPTVTSPSRVYLYFGGLALVCLLSIVLFSYCICVGYIARNAVMLQIGGYGVGFERYLVIVTVVYFISGVIWMRGREKRKAQPAA